MMMEWNLSLRELAQQTLDVAADYWQHYTPGWSVADEGRRDLAKWIKKFSLQEVLSAMDVAATHYLRFEAEGAIIEESWDSAFSKIPGICRVERESKDDPEIRELYFIRGIARRNCENSFRNAEALELLKDARFYGISTDTLRTVAIESYSWYRFSTDLRLLIREARASSEGESDET